MLEQIRVILSHPSHPGNIGAAARAMKTMGLTQLVLINPASFPSAEATARASGADDVLANARVVESLDEALKGVHLVLGTSARLRSVPLDQVPPREAAERAFAQTSGSVTALLFGTEKSGLDNSEIDRCHALVNIPSNPDYSSLNLGSAVQVVCYEVRVAALAAGEAAVPQMPEHEPAPAHQVEGLMEHFEQTLEAIGFLEGRQSITLKKRLRRLVQRTAPSETEIHILRGIFATCLKQRSANSSD
ncbi:MAG: RNA methyltransferase [Pseudomonadota bacterium]